ncbi:ABC transporter substrate-binding protein [Streptomyces sp. NPDC102381]|uniref:ABC transporter substrate-binding protein n=1 Tax=Streptomyces sp. NPDC102381 TaxID=3366164 RepID=UPI003800335E
MSSTTKCSTLRTLGAALTMAAALTACSTANTPSTEGGKQILTLAANGGTALKSLLPAFEKQNPDIKVVVKDYPQNYREVIGPQLAGGNAPDVIQVPPGGGNNVSAKLAGKRGYYADLSDAPWASEVPASAREQLSTDDGTLVGVPMTLSSIGGIYNQGALDKAGLSVPQTWSQVLKLCADARKAGKTAYGLGLSDTWTTQMIPYALTSSLVYGPEPKFIDQQLADKASFAKSGWSTALDKYLQMERAGCFNKSPNGTPYSQVQDAIRAGDTLATVSVAAETGSIASTGPKDLKLTYAAFPATDDPKQTFLPTSVGPAYGINAKSSHKDLAQKFLKFLAKPKTQLAHAKAFGDAAAMPGDQPQDSEVAKVVEHFTTVKRTTTWPDRLWPSTTTQPALFDGVQGLFSKQDSVGDVLSNMDGAFQQAR